MRFTHTGFQTLKSDQQAKRSNLLFFKFRTLLGSCQKKGVTFCKGCPTSLMAVGTYSKLKSSFSLMAGSLPPPPKGVSLEHFWGAHITYFRLQMKNKKINKKKLTTHTLPRSILVDFRRFSDFSAFMLHCAIIFEDRKILNTAI